MGRMLILFMLAAWHPAAAKAHSITVGDLEFNHFSSGVNTLTVNNFTGGNNLGVFPVVNDVTFEDVVVTLTKSDDSTLRFDLGSVGPGTNTSIQVSDSLLVKRARITATLHGVKFEPNDEHSSMFIANSKIRFTLLPSVGTYLIASLDLGTMRASESSEECRDAHRKSGADSEGVARGESNCEPSER